MSEIQLENKSEDIKYIKTSDLKNVIFESINDEYSYGKLGNITIIINNKTGYFNAAKLCAQAGKKFPHWKSLESANEIISHVAKRFNLDSRDVIFTPKGLNIHLRGSYAHPKLATTIAMWCDPSFALVVDDIVVGFFAERMANELKAQIKVCEDTIAKRDMSIKKKDNKIDKLIADVREQRTLAEEQKALTERLINICEKQGIKIDTQTKKIDRQTKKIDKQIGMLEDMGDTLETVANERVPRCDEVDDSTLYIVKKNEDADDYSEDETYYEYVVIRALKKNAANTIKNKKKLYPQMKIVHQVDYTPNAINLWKRYLSSYGKYIDRKGCEFNREPGYSESRMIRHLNSIHAKRFDY